MCVCVAARGVCESRPGVCGRGRCVDQPGGKHTCVCDQGYQPNSQRTYCQGEHAQKMCFYLMDERKIREFYSNMLQKLF